jgi:hypothetical protein
VYLYLEPLAGAVASLFYLALLAHAQHFYATSARPLGLALSAHLLGWFAQVAIGHALLEKRRPALMTSLFSSLVLAPFFVVIEVRARRQHVVWLPARDAGFVTVHVVTTHARVCARALQVLFACGYKPALHAELRARVSREVGAWRAAQAQQKRR